MWYSDNSRCDDALNEPADREHSPRKCAKSFVGLCH